MKARGAGFISLNNIKKNQDIVVPVFLVLVCLLVAFAIAKGGVISALFILIVAFGVPTVYGVLIHPKFAIITFFIASYLLFIPEKMDTRGFPLGTVMDALEYLLIIGFFIKQRTDRQWNLFDDPLSWWLLAWIVYNFVEVANPGGNPFAWLYTIRTTAVIIFMYHVFVYQIREVSFIKTLFKIWIFLAFLGALDAFKQEYFSFFQFEHDYLFSDPVKIELLFIDGHLRKFGIFSDPVAFAYNMCSVCLVCIVFIAGPIKIYKKIVLGCLVAFNVTCMLYSGTRGAFPLIPVTLILFGILNFNKQILIFFIIGAIMFAALIFMPSKNPNILRFQTAFQPNNDPSFLLRKANQARIRPFILTHPIGGGLGATGMWGRRFSPGSMLADFPPDSGYVRVAVELGFLGILLLCTVIFVALYTGINNHFLIHDPMLKAINLSATLVVFVYNVGNYPQEAIVQFPSNMLFFLCMALIPISYRLDKQKTEQEKLNRPLLDEKPAA